MAKSPIKDAVRIPVRRVGDRWELLDGGEVLTRADAMGELVLSRADVHDAALLEKLDRRFAVQVGSEGEELLVALSIRWLDR